MRIKRKHGLGIIAGTLVAACAVPLAMNTASAHPGCAGKRAPDHGDCRAVKPAHILDKEGHDTGRVLQADTDDKGEKNGDYMHTYTSDKPGYTWIKVYFDVASPNKNAEGRVPTDALVPYNPHG